MSDPAWLSELNPQQRAAATHGDGPLLILAGAGTGKTKTLAARVACLLDRGVSPERLLLLTFTRRAAQEMVRRAELARPGSGAGARRVWGGTFHSVANRLLRRYGCAVGLAPDFTVLDQSDAGDLLNLVRQERGLHSREKRFPKKGTLLDIYSRCVNTQRSLDKILPDDFPWCAEFGPEMRGLFVAYTDRKQARHLLDYDDLLLFWFHLMETTEAGAHLATQFDHILVDEYQDTNKLQADILARMAGSKRNLTVVGDDAQSIYSFRAATVRNILEFPKQFPGTTIITLEQNYRSTQPILAASNAVIGKARKGFAKNLWSEKKSGQRPLLVNCLDEAQQCRFVCAKILEHREAGVALKKQAVLFRTAHWSDMLEVELTRRNIPFVKFGGLRFLEAAHVKDLLAILRLIENPRDEISWLRVLQLLPGIGGATASHLMQLFASALYDLRALEHCSVPPSAREPFRELCAVLKQFSGSDKTQQLGLQIERIRQFYEPIFREHYDHAEVRIRDLEQLSAVAAGFGSREQFLSELTLDPPSATSDWAGAPLKDEDYLILSTIHSAKGCEWDVTFLIHATDGILPSDLSTGDPEQIEEERRLLYVAMTRARNWLYVCFPLRYYETKQPISNRHGFAQLTRFITSDIRSRFESLTLELPKAAPGETGSGKVEANVRAKIRQQWSSGDADAAK